jgi:TolB protein
MEASGANPLRLTTHSAEDQEPAWSPDGNKIAFSSKRDGNFEIYIMNPSGTQQINLTNNAAQDSSPTWSPGEIPDED